VRILLDTHCWLWMVGSPERFSSTTRDLLADSGHELLLSAASSWEIAIKCALGKLGLPGSPDIVVPDWMRRSGVTALPVHHGHALETANLPHHHSDPFDRLLIAQARLEAVPLLTADVTLRAYDVEVIEA
jgi:PIN domain nuclease of toxin-antitoxin system